MTMTDIKHKQIIDDVLSARHDLIALAQAHDLTPQQLAGWIGQPANHRVLLDLCVLADIQTQLLLSRYRLIAAGRLIKLATEEGEGDTARKACVDLLKLDLKRAVPDAAAEDGYDDLPSAESLYGEGSGG